MNEPWWKLDEPHTKLVPYATTLEARARPRVLMDYFFRSVYEGRPFRSVGAGASADFSRFMQRAQARLNSTKSAVDTIVNRLIKRRAMPIMTATDADWSLKTRARRLSRYVRSMLAGSEFEALSPQALYDACIVGTGIVQVVEDGPAVAFERVPRDEVFLEDRELRYNTPRQLHRKRRISRWVLWEKFPDKAARKAIEQASASDRSVDRILGAQPSDEDDDQVDVWESWRLPSTCDSDDGMHAVCIEGATLRAECWEQDVFPFSFMHWDSPAQGFWGTGLVESSLGLQVAIDRSLAAILENAEATSGMHVFLRRGSAVPKGHLGGSGARVVEYDGAIPPQFVAPSPFNPSQFSLLQWLDAQVHEKSGVSQAAASSKSPLGLNASGVALDNMMDIESDRFAEKELNYGHFRLSLARCIVAVNKQAAERDEDDGARRVITWDDKDVLRSIDWDRVDMKRDQFAYRLEPTNFLPETRAGKLAAISELSKAGVFTDPSVISSLFDEPDLERANRMQNAPINAIEAMLEDACDLDEDLPTPDPHMDLSLVVKLAKEEYQRLLANKAPETVRSRLRDLIGLAQAELERASAPPPADPMAGGMPPPGADPMAMPVPVPTEAPGAPPPGMPGGMPMPMPGGMQ